MKNIKSGEIWYISFDPSIGAEIQKTRPALVISSNIYNMASQTVFVVPLTSVIPKKERSIFYVKVKSDKTSQLSVDSYANVSQFRAVAKQRFHKKIGNFNSKIKEDILKKFMTIVDFDVLQLRYF